MDNSTQLQIEAMLAMVAQALAACEAKDFDLVVRLSAQQESELATLLPQWQAGNTSLPVALRPQLQQLVAQRELLQQQIAVWIDSLREEMQSVSQNNRLLKTYSL